MSLKLYVDDIKLYSCYDVTSTCENDLCVAINRQCEWSDTWLLSIAAHKCLHVISAVIDLLLFHKDRFTRIRTLFFHRWTVKDLGVVVDHHLKFDIHISLADRKATLRSIADSEMLSSHNDLLLKAYITYVRPILEYCSPVWSPHLKNLIHEIESILKFFTKWLPGLWHLPHPKRLQLLNLHSLEYRRISYDLTLCYQFSNGYCDTTLTDCYAPPLIGGSIKRCFCLTSVRLTSVCRVHRA